MGDEQGAQSVAALCLSCWSFPTTVAGTGGVAPLDLVLYQHRGDGMTLMNVSLPLPSWFTLVLSPKTTNQLVVILVLAVGAEAPLLAPGCQNPHPL